ncbi:MAG TPA: gliding motility protein GldM [Prolixibacteraceae bacterium]|nr:gliding motility protein GldM [Prolixibacteraceae bacterium]
MMYLVLTAMLALNVASEVLTSFRIVDASLVQTLNNVNKKNQQIYASFDAAYAQNPTKVEDWKNKADQVKLKTAELITKITDLKEQLVLASGGTPLKSADPGFILPPEDPTMVNSKGDTILIKKEDDLNTPSEIMIRQKKATDLKNSINAYSDFLTSNIEEGSPLRESIVKQLDTPDLKPNLSEGGEKKTWESLYFESKPLIAVITLLSKMQIDIQNAETNVITSLFSQIDAASFKFNKLGARILAKSTYILEGDQFEAEIFLAAEDTTQQPKIFVGNTELTVHDGKALYKATTSKVGTFKWGGLIKYKNPDGDINSYPFEGEYQVGRPSVTISPTKMNVFYLGIANPIKVSVPGIASENLEVSVSNGRIQKDGEDYFVYPAKLDIQGKNTSVSVTAKMDGGIKSMGSMIFRVKEVPPPVATIGGQNGGTMRREELLAENGLFAELKDFDFDLKFRIIQFDVTFSGAGGYVKTYKSTDNKFTTDQKDQFGKLTQGSLIFIDNILAKGDDGTTRPLAPISFKIR